MIVVMSRGAAFWESASTLVVRLATVHPAHWFAGGRISDPVRTVSPPPPPPPPSPHANSAAHAKTIHQRFPLGAVQFMLPPAIGAAQNAFETSMVALGVKSVVRPESLS